MDFTLELQSDKVRLRPVRLEDYTQFRALTNDASMWTWFTSDLSVNSILKTWVADAVKQTNERQRLAFTIVDIQQKKVIGSTSFGNISEHDKRIEIGWTWIGKSFWGKGFNDEVKFLMLNFCFENLQFERVELKTDVLNVAARKALLRMGFIEEGILRSHTLMTHNRRRDTIYYSMLKHEWKTKKVNFTKDLL